MSLIDDNIKLFAPTVRVNPTPKPREKSLQDTCANDDVNVAADGTWRLCELLKRRLESLVVFLGKDEPGGSEKLQRRHELTTEAARTLAKAVEFAMPLLSESTQLGVKQGAEELKNG